MNILAFTDMHGSPQAFRRILGKAGKADALVCAGDFTIFQHDLRRILREIHGIGKPAIIIPGNHEEHSEIVRACGRYHLLITSSVHTLGSTVFLSMSGNGFAHEDPGFEKAAVGFLRAALKARKAGLAVVLVTHAPPFGTRLDSVMGGHCGNKSIRRFILKAQPDLAICGHIHENSGRQDILGKTAVFNPGPFGMLLSASSGSAHPHGRA